MLRTIYTPHQEIQYIVRHIRKYKKYVTSGNTGCTPYQERLTTLYTPHQEIQYILRHIKKYIKYATSGNAGCTPYQEMLKTIYTPHQEIQKVRHIRKYRMYVCLKNNIYATSGETMYCTPHQDIQKVRHIRKYRMYAISGNAKNNIYATSGNTIYCTPHQEIQKVRHIRKYTMYATSGSTRSTPYQETQCFRMPHQETWHPFDVAYQILVRHIRKLCTPHQWIRRIRIRGAHFAAKILPGIMI